jgi:hypothetical protein
VRRSSWRRVAWRRVAWRLLAWRRVELLSRRWERKLGATERRRSEDDDDEGHHVKIDDEIDEIDDEGHR